MQNLSNHYSNRQGLTPMLHACGCDTTIITTHLYNNQTRSHYIFYLANVSQNMYHMVLQIKYNRPTDQIAHQACRITIFIVRSSIKLCYLLLNKTVWHYSHTKALKIMYICKSDPTESSVYKPPVWCRGQTNCCDNIKANCLIQVQLKPNIYH